MKLNTLDFDFARGDFLVDGTPLLALLKKHEGVRPEAHLPSVLARSGACDRLLGLAEPDLQGGHVAIYLCGHCGGYDGNPIGVRLHLDATCAAWKDLGYHYDYAEQESHRFARVVGYSFDPTEYLRLLHQLRLLEPAAT
jgi:hypothetical protein